MMSSKSFRVLSYAAYLFIIDAFVSLVISAAIPTAQAESTSEIVQSPSLQQLNQIRENKLGPPLEYSEEVNSVEDEPTLEGFTQELQDVIEEVFEPTFFLKAIRFEGNNIYTYDELIQPFVEFIGKNVSFEDLKSASLEAESIYKRDGYVTSRVILPEQDFESGKITLRVVEGYIESISVTGSSPGHQKYVQKFLSVIPVGDNKKPFNYNTLERQLLLIRDFGGLDFQVSIAKGSKTGSSILAVDLKKDSISGNLSLDNNLPDSLADFQSSLAVKYSAPLSQPINFVGVGSYGYGGGLISGFASLSTPIGIKGITTDFLYSHTSTDSSDLYSSVGKLNTKGTSDYWSLGVSYPILIERNSKLSVSLKGTLQNSSNDLYLDNLKAMNISTDNIKALRFSVDAYKLTPNSSNSLSFNVNQGLGSDSLDSGEFPSNPNADDNFTSANLELYRIQRLFNPKTFLTLKAKGQLSSSSLLSPEAFTYGGQDFGRAFRGTHILGDEGWASSVELSHQLDAKLFKRDLNYTLFTWYDYGETSYKKGPVTDYNASSYGLGMRANVSSISMEVGVGIPANDSLNSGKTGFEHSNVFFNAGWKF